MAQRSRPLVAGGCSLPYLRRDRAVSMARRARTSVVFTLPSSPGVRRSKKQWRSDRDAVRNAGRNVSVTEAWYPGEVESGEGQWCQCRARRRSTLRRLPSLHPEMTSNAPATAESAREVERGRG